jgi:uncharacterized protein YeaO (DUF488 family)
MSAKRRISIRTKRAYEPPTKDDGFRVLVDRLWPRGLKHSARIDLWLKEIAPSAALRKWFAHDPAKWTTFRARYSEELENRPAAVAQLKQLLRKGTVTFVFSAKNERHNNAVALKDYLESS